MAQINHDQLFKQLLTTFFVEFLELFFPQVLDYLNPDSITFEDKELFTDLSGGDKKILDLVALAKFRDRDYTFLVHVENQSYEQDEFPERMYSYHCVLFLKYRRPIYPNLSPTKSVWVTNFSRAIKYNGISTKRTNHATYY